MFSPDSRFLQILTRLTELVVLNILFLVTCLPVFTAGAAAAALYTVCFRLMREEYSGVVRPYFRAFRENFGVATRAWGILLAVILPAGFYLHRLLPLGGSARLLCLPFLLILALGLMTAAYAFPWISQFHNTALQSLKNALLLSASHLPRTLAVLAISLLPVLMLFWDTELFFRVSFLWAAFYFAAAAYMHTGLLWHVFKPYRTP